MTEIDVDTLLAEAGTVREPSAKKLLAQVAFAAYQSWGDFSAALTASCRYCDWRDDPGHRQICPGCNRLFIRDRYQLRRCPACRRKFKRTCAGCGRQFSATHYLLKRCPPCRVEWLKRPRGQLEQERRSCGRCGEPFVPRSWNAKYCRECQ